MELFTTMRLSVTLDIWEWVYNDDKFSDELCDDLIATARFIDCGYHDDHEEDFLIMSHIKVEEANTWTLADKLKVIGPRCKYARCVDNFVWFPPIMIVNNEEWFNRFLAGTLFVVGPDDDESKVEDSGLSYETYLELLENPRPWGPRFVSDFSENFEIAALNSNDFIYFEEKDTFFSDFLTQSDEIAQKAAEADCAPISFEISNTTCTDVDFLPLEVFHEASIGLFESSTTEVFDLCVESSCGLFSRTTLFEVGINLETCTICSLLLLGKDRPRLFTRHLFPFKIEDR